MRIWWLINLEVGGVNIENNNKKQHGFDMDLFTEAGGTEFEREGFTLNNRRSLAFSPCVLLL